ncbi:uncharacterized protein LOC128358965 [Scomber japonicus]|uniref:uncharacterized protein LOC128358965 n=1 Tax=Scomber japonicus TaxID=13676 RepID=UPI002306947E|nr:uncharacterized protein LOC128358965 [Scomber japonicus]XP_053175357.1 uncharacterized protein LOC128358965 [Scomber japonicus]
MMSKNISASHSIKPKAPTISVKEINGNFEVTWETNWNRSVSDYLHAEVTYHKKGDTKEPPHKVNASHSYDIRGQDLEPSTTYVVSVRNYLNWSGLYSDSSQELEFTTSASRPMLFLSVIVCLTIAAVIITSVVMGCFQKLKAKWWDTVTECPNPELLEMRPGQQMFLKPTQTSISSVSIETAVVNNSKPRLKGSLTESSIGMSISSSSANIEPADIKAGVQDALSIAFAHGPKSSMATCQLTESNKDDGFLSASYSPYSTADDLKNSPQFTNFHNMTYLIGTPTCEIMSSSENQTQAKILCDSAYHPSEGDGMTFLDKQAPSCEDPAQ